MNAATRTTTTIVLALAALTLAGCGDDKPTMEECIALGDRLDADNPRPSADAPGAEWDAYADQIFDQTEQVRACVADVDD